MKKPERSTVVVGGALAGLIVLAAFIAIFVWYAKTVIPHTYSTAYTNFFWGFIHGLFIIPTFFWSLFADTVTIYQAPNAGNLYNIGYFIGISIILGGSHGARSRTAKAK
jgi:hypothetical protein